MLRLKKYSCRSKYYYVRGAIKGSRVFESTGTEDLGLATEYLNKRSLSLYRDNVLSATEWTAVTPEMVKELALLSHRANNRSQKRERHQRITPDFITAMYLKQRGRCAVSGMPFRLDCIREGILTSRAFAPSLDRLDNAKGYEMGNVRLVCRIANFAMNTWGDGALVELSLSIAHMWENMCNLQIQRGRLVKNATDEIAESQIIQ